MIDNGFENQFDRFIDINMEQFNQYMLKPE